jgi:mono/diheme cytochrome c family protein
MNNFLIKLFIILFILTTIIYLTRGEDNIKIKNIYAQTCKSCHGETGKGDTLLGSKLNIKDFVNVKANDEQMFKSIKEGIKRGDKVVMKTSSLTNDEIKELVKYIRNFKK